METAEQKAQSLISVHMDYFWEVSLEGVFCAFELATCRRRIAGIKDHGFECLQRAGTSSDPAEASKMLSTAIEVIRNSDYQSYPEDLTDAQQSVD